MTYYNLDANKDIPTLSDSINNFYLDIAMGKVPGIKYALLSGKNPGIDPQDPVVSVDIWSMANEVPKVNYPVNNIAVTIFVSSTNISDIGQSIIIEGLAAGYVEQTGVAITNGQNQVEVKDLLGNSITFLRFFTAQNLGATNLAGDLYVAESDTLVAGKPIELTTIYSKIFIGDDRSFDAIYTIPAGKVGNATLVNFAVARGRDALLETFIKFEGGIPLKTNSFPIFQAFVAPPIMPAIPLLIPEKVDLIFSTQVNNIDTSVTARADFIIIDQELLA